jgi:hypothetical protein
VKHLSIALVGASLLFLCGCTEEKLRDQPKSAATTLVAPVSPERKTVPEHQVADAPRAAARMAARPSYSADEEERSGPPIVSDADTATLSTIGTVQASAQAADRKIIRDASLTIETDSPTDGLRRITSIAETNGGFIVTSDFKHNDGGAQARPTQTVTVVARVPSSRFDSALDQIHGVGSRVISEKVSGQDVSEEYLDLEARLRTKKALEAQFLDIMKQARKVSDALEVQSQLGDVRTEIERLEGRRRFLENQAALSTITTTLQMPIIAATTSGFGTTIKRAFGDAVDTAASIVLFVIQAVIVLVPIAIFFGLPGWVVWRMVRRRVVLFRKPEPSPIPNK